MSVTGRGLLTPRQPAHCRTEDLARTFRPHPGFANAAAHSWGTPSTWGFLATGAAGLGAFAARQARARDPLLPPRVVLDRNRGGAYLAMLFVSAGVFGIFLFFAFYLQTTLGYSPLVTGLPTNLSRPEIAAELFSTAFAGSPVGQARHHAGRAGPAVACPVVASAGTGDGVPGRASGPRRSRAPPMTAPPAKMPAIHQNAVS